MKEILKKQTQQEFLKTLQKHPDVMKKAKDIAHLQILSDSLFSMDEAGGLFDLMPAKEIPTKEEYFNWLEEVVRLLNP